MVKKEVIEECANGISDKRDKRDQEIMLKEHGKAHAIAYMDQWSVAKVEQDQDRANQKATCGNGTWSLGQL